MHAPLPAELAAWAVPALVTARVLPLVLVAPWLGPLQVPMRLKLVLALALAVLVVPLEAARTSAVAPESWQRLLVLLGGELLVGLLLGLGVRILFAGMQLAGQLISRSSGLELAEVFDPGFRGSVPVFSQLLVYTSTAAFLAIGGHRKALGALLDTFVWLPVGQAGVGSSAGEAVTSLVTQSFVLGLRAAAPVLVALLLATLVLGIISRTVPQLNLFALGLGTNVIVALVALGLSLGAACWVFDEHLELALETARSAISRQ